MRVNIIQTLQADYVEAARARGVSETAGGARHAFRNALVPVVTVMGLQVGAAARRRRAHRDDLQLAGHRAGARHYLNKRDYVAVQGIVTVFALVVVVVSLLIDIVTALIDPRVRY